MVEIKREIWYNRMMKTSPIEAKLYLSDQHFGEQNPRRSIMEKKFMEFLEAYNFKIKKVIDCGDGLDCDLLEKSLGKTREEIDEINTQEAHEITHFYNGVLPKGGEVSVLLGNHQSGIVENEVTAKSVEDEKNNSTQRLQQYIDNEISPETSGIHFDVMSGIQEVEKDVVVEHGTYYDVFSTVRDILSEFTKDMTLEEKLEKLNRNPNIEKELQKFWQKMKKNWWIIRKLGGENYEALFDIFHQMKDVEAGLNRFKNTNIPLSHSHNEYVLKQLELMQKLAGGAKLTMISGHRHRKDAQVKDNLLSISLGDWEHSNKTPTTAFHVPDGETDRWVIAEYRREDDSFNLNQKQGEGHWRILKEFTFNVDENKWEEKFETSLKSVGEEAIGDEWDKYEIEGELKQEID